MSYRFLTREEMVSVSAPLVNEVHRDCQTLRTHPLARAMGELVTEAHCRLLDTQRIGPTPERLVEIKETLQGLGERHRDVLRGIYHGLLAQEYVAKDPGDKAAARALRTKMFPENLMAVRKSYRGHAGQAALLKRRLTNEDLEALRRLGTLTGTNLAELVDEWCSLAAAMGELEDERAGNDHGTPSAAEVTAARYHWIRTMQAFLTTLPLHTEMPGEVLAIVARVRKAIEVTGARRRTRTTTADATDTDATEAVDTEAIEVAEAVDSPHKMVGDTTRETESMAERGLTVASSPAMHGATEPAGEETSMDRAGHGMEEHRTNPLAGGHEVPDSG